jgi:hypothetical protein
MINQELSPAWITWIQQNLAIKVAPETIYDLMVQNHLDPDEARTAIRILSAVPAGSSDEAAAAKQQRYYSSVMKKYLSIQEQDPDYTVIKKISSPGREEFFHEYWTRSRPVVIKGIADAWPARTKWTFDYLKSNFADEEIEIQADRENDQFYEINSVSHRQKIKLGDFVDMIVNSDGTNNFYMTANNHAIGKTKLQSLLDDTGDMPAYASKPERVGFWHLWVGPKGTKTPLHHDENGLLHLQLKGRKTWKFISPLDAPNIYHRVAVFSNVDIYNLDFEKYPAMQDVKILEVTVEEGEAMFLPQGWWHAVEALDHSISLAMVAFDWPNHWRLDYPN